MDEIKVWDPVVRITHWALAILVIANFINEEGQWAHRWVGYSASGLVVLRVLWGFVGSHHARFSDWWPTPSKVLGYLKAKRRGNAPRYIGHNPLGALMMLFLVGLVLNQGVTGFMMGTDAFFGEEWLEQWHAFSADLFMVAVGLHVVGALYESWRTKENLPAAMVHGKKRRG